MPRSVFWLTVVLVLVGLLGMRESRQRDGVLAAVDVGFLDWLMANSDNARREEANKVGVTLVEIDEATLNDRAVNGSGTSPFANSPAGPRAKSAAAGVPEPPLSAMDYAMFLQGAESLGAAVVAVEPVLAWPRERQQGEFERILLNQALRASKLLLGVRAAGERRRLAEPPAGAETGLPQSRPLSPLAGSGGGLPTANPATVVAPLRGVRGNVAALPELTDLARRPAERLLLAGTPGPVDLPAGTVGGDGDGVTRVVPLLFRGPNDEVLPAFVLQAAMLLFRLTPEEITVDLDAGVVNLGGTTRVPIDPAGGMRVDFTTFHRRSRFALDDFLLAAAGNAATVRLPPAGGVVLIGRCDPAARTLSLPPGEPGTPAELLAAALDTLAQRRFVVRVPWGYDLWVIAGVATLGWALLPLRRGTALALTGAFFPVYTLITLAIFALGRLWLPWALPVVLLLSLGLLLTGLGGAAIKTEG